MSFTLRRKRARARLKQAPSLDEVKKTVRETADRLGPYAESARDSAAERLTEARKWAAPRIEDAADAVQETVAPRVSSVLASTAERVEPVRKEAKRRGRAAAKALKGQRLRPRRRWPIALLCFVAGSVVGVIVAASRMGATPLPPPGLATSDSDASNAEADGAAKNRIHAD